MKAGRSQLDTAVLVLIISHLCFYAPCELTRLPVCKLCSGSVLNETAVGHFCFVSNGRLEGRCCLKNDSNSNGTERIIGLDLSNCSLKQVDDLHEAATAYMIDLSLNPLVNLSDSVFEGFSDLNYMILPIDIFCPGGNQSWSKVELREGSRLCEDPKNMCNQTGQLVIDCPENSLCTPYGPGFFECNCADNYYGYKCLREGEFPALQVFGPLGASTVVLSFLLWVTQRRKAKAL
ncbi:all-trans retinoic acid-induced differentiation factor [Cynoglossus semilaevis]|uniref:all-trans retinoic acid-induced differentiation factor n=1 Tax=Cynoglossus semilaevis TaxID=244447 RepID=UPI0004985832|nr:all-trans retinoic acid-induced differentiation factor [Cynoglossus semilaevis]